ncbi:Hypothetical predicted protein [Octopus vulgaris]|nr:Hypothetical predicted protein [Octopus vulgaris]
MGILNTFWTIVLLVLTLADCTPATVYISNGTNILKIRKGHKKESIFSQLFKFELNNIIVNNSHLKLILRESSLKYNTEHTVKLQTTLTMERQSVTSLSFYSCAKSY